jgi:rhodanese-related sulfurtransferase
MDRARTLAHLQYISVNRLAQLPGDVGLYPTHGAGSFCTSTAAGEHTSTIGREELTNPVLQYPDKESFIEGQLDGLQPYPAYYAHMGPANLRGPEPMPPATLPELTVADIDEATVIDIRPAEQYAAGHLPGSIGIPFGDQVGVWAGWILPFDCEIVLVAEHGQDVDEAHRQFGRIGFDRVRGVVYEFPADVDLVSFEVRKLSEFIAGLEPEDQLVDVRAPDEWEEGHVIGSLHMYVPDLFEDPSRLDAEHTTWLLCESGFRATIAAAALEQRGMVPAVLVGHGVTDLLKRGVTALG